MRAIFKLIQLFCVLLFAATASATLLFSPSGAKPVAKRAFSDTRGLTGMTNAQRLAAGLPLLPPRTRTSTAKRSGVSILPVTGRIQVHRADTGDLVGEVSKSTGSFGKFFLNSGSIFNSNTWSALVAQVGTTSQVNFLDTQRNRYFAGVQDPLHVVTTNDPSFAYLGLSDSTSPGSTPQPNKNPSGQPTWSAESAIWIYSAGTREITVQWVASDGSTPDTAIYYDPDTAQFCLTLSPASFVGAHPNAYRVNFNLSLP
ncbi:hypothetical protein FS837_002484 [Tulasnella sp. UAMH 9824]|nr:hypothetical protein FS837_002484 [Tulasnella sp. UAMH 9824]